MYLLILNFCLFYFFPEIGGEENSLLVSDLCLMSKQDQNAPALIDGN